MYGNIILKSLLNGVGGVGSVRAWVRGSTFGVGGVCSVGSVGQNFDVAVVAGVGQKHGMSLNVLLFNHTHRKYCVF